MKQSVHLIYFSPTGTTRKIVEAVADGMAEGQVSHYDLTLSSEAPEKKIEDGVAVMGIPVYAGRVPEDCLARMAKITAEDLPVVLIALYGNREFEDALVELRDVAVAQGFRPVAAGAFIGEHSYSTSEYPIAMGRPDADDVQIAVSFGRRVAQKLERGNRSTPVIEGDVPYKERVQFGGIAPKTDEAKCSHCGKCASVCPKEVIAVSEVVETDAASCIMCSACIKICDAQARFFDHPMIEERRKMLLTHCSTPKAPKTFI